jgi:serine/threonine protein kinase
VELYWSKGHNSGMALDPVVGTEVAQYRTERLIGRGGMSVVYLAEHTRLKRKVALKLLAPQLAQDDEYEVVSGGGGC